MPEVKVLVVGIHDHLDDTKMDIGSTTTLIKSDINIIVDPGAFVNKDKLLLALKSEGLTPEDIQAVILTHTHFDHTANTFLFPQAKVYLRFKHGNYPGMFQKIDQGYLQRFDLINESIADGVQIIETTGHSIDHISVVVGTDLGKIVIAGDAITKKEWVNTAKQPEVDFVYSVEDFNKSREKILATADYIVPGHGSMFKVEK